MKKSKEVDEYDKCLINGYYRQIQKMINIDSPYYNTPPLVVYLTILYHLIFEYFTVGGRGMTINESLDIVDTNKSDGWGETVYGNVEIDGSIKAIYKWKFEIISNPDSKIITFGIDSSNKQFVDGYFYEKGHDTSFYAYKTSKYGGYKLSPTTSPLQCDYDDETSKSGDLIIMELDTMNRTISFHHNETDLGIMFENIDFNEVTYNMAVYLYTSDQSVKLIDFSRSTPKSNLI